MKKLDEIRNEIAARKGEIRRKFKVKEIGVFGSYARGEQKRKSDIDILVEFAGPISLFKFVDLEFYLEELLGAKVDLVSKRALKPHIGKRILQEVVYV